MNQTNIYDPFTVEPLTLKQIRQLYAERLIKDFPSDEIRRLTNLERSYQRGEYLCFGAMSNGSILAYAFFVKLGENDCALLDYFAVAPEHRDHGLGGAFLRKLMAGPLRGLQGALLEIEDPSKAESEAERSLRERRMQFYLRNGMVSTGVRSKAFGVDFLLLSMPVGSSPSPDDVRRMYARLYHAILSADVYAMQVVIH